MTTVHYISLRIEQEEWLRYYAGEATHLRCVSTSGKVIHLAARHFRPFTTRDGIEGLFKPPYVKIVLSRWYAWGK